MPKNFNGYLYALFAIFFWSFNVIYAKYLAHVFTPFEISFIRWVIPALLFLPFTYKTILSCLNEYKHHAGIILIMALSGLGFQNTFVYYAGLTSNAIDMALIGATSPIFLIIFSAIFLHTRITFLQIIGIICALIGVAVIITDGNLSNIKQMPLTIGDLWMFLAALIFAAYGVAQKKLPSNLPQIPALTLMICISSLIFLPLAAYDFSTHVPTGITKTDILILIILAVFNSGIAYLFWNKALNIIGTLKTGTMYYLMPVFSAIEAYFLLDEQIFPSQIYGALLVICGILISNLKKQTPPKISDKSL